MIDLLTEIRQGARALYLSRGSTVAAALILAVGIAANSAIFRGLRDLGWKEPEQFTAHGCEIDIDERETALRKLEARAS